jgi:DNA repair exonuclease SbcCD ATPase subunit
MAANSAKVQEHSLLVNFEGEDSSKPTPIQRVVSLLEEMKAQLDKEVANDGEIYDKMVCWCETNDKEKTKAIADADASLKDLESDIQSMAARDGELEVKIAAMKTELADKKESLSKATSLREKEAAEFNAGEKETIQAVTMLKNAVTILGKHNAGLIQMTPAVQESMGAALRWVALKHEELLELNTERGALRGSSAAPASVASLLAVATNAGQAKDAASVAFDARMLKALSGGHASDSDVPLNFGASILAKAAGHDDAALVQQPMTQSYAPQSGQIFGILKQMKEEFENDLSADQKAEIKAQEEYTSLKAASEKAIDAGAAKLDEMENEFATNTKGLSDAKEDHQTTLDTRSADTKFLQNLKLRCQDLDREFAKRSKARGEEVKAVAETIAILRDDDARTLFAKKSGSAASFVQVKASNTAAMKARSLAASVLLKAARRQSPDLDGYQIYKPSDNKPHEQLAALAVSVQLDAFSKVKKAIDDMVADLKVQQSKEVEKKAFCNKEFNNNEKMTYTTQETLDDLKDKLAGLEATLSKLAEETKAAKTEIADMEVAIKQASEDREKENKEYQEEINDQRMMQAILQKALERMQKVYKQKGGDFLQQEPPVQFKPTGQNAGASPVIGLLEQIIGDSKSVEADGIEGEKKAQAAYEEFIINANNSIQALNDAIQAKADAIAEATLEKSESESQAKSTQERLDDLGQVAGDLHADCDFVLKNFDIRQKARLQEIEALGNAKAFLDGQQD